jgi:hypothetical protein
MIESKGGVRGLFKACCEHLGDRPTQRAKPEVLLQPKGDEARIDIQAYQGPYIEVG